jgi:glycosyltransferase involved in cell wall biosynthesis
MASTSNHSRSGTLLSRFGKVSVVVTSYEHEAFIGPCLESVRRQDYEDWECIVVVDGSPDRTAQKATEVAGQDKRFRVVTKENGGPSSAQNMGARLVSSDSRYLVFLDGDDLLSPSFLSRLAAYLHETPGVGVVTCAFVRLDPKGNIIGLGRRARCTPGFLGLPRKLRSHEKQTPFVSFFCATGQGPYALYRRDVFERTAGFDESFCPHEDTDMFCQMALLAEVHFLPEVLYQKREHPGSLTYMASSEALRKCRSFRMDAYRIFRAKWQGNIPADEKGSAQLAAARSFYFGFHKPCRDLKIAWAALVETRRRPRSAKLAVKLVWEAAKHWWIYGVFKRQPPTPDEVYPLLDKADDVLRNSGSSANFSEKAYY